MSEQGRNLDRHEADPNQSHEENASTGGPNLILIYSLIVLALIAAIGFALMIVFPFYRRH